MKRSGFKNPGTWTGLKRYTAIRTKKPGLRRVAHSTQPPTPAEEARFAAMRVIGCLACRMNRQRGIATASFKLRELEIHHLLSGGRRIGHHATICLCHYHHQGKRLPFLDTGYKAQAQVFGPSMEREPARFRAMYGSQDQLLEQQNALLARMDACAMRPEPELVHG